MSQKLARLMAAVAEPTFRARPASAAAQQQQPEPELEPIPRWEMVPPPSVLRPEETNWRLLIDEDPWGLGRDRSIAPERRRRGILEFFRPDPVRNAADELRASIEPFRYRGASYDAAQDVTYRNLDDDRLFIRQMPYHDGGTLSPLPATAGYNPDFAGMINARKEADTLSDDELRDVLRRAAERQREERSRGLERRPENWLRRLVELPWFLEWILPETGGLPDEEGR